MRTTGNPAFRNLQRGGYATFDERPAAQPGFGPPTQQQPGYPGMAQPAERPMTVDDVVTRTAITLGVLVAAAALTWISGQWWLALPGLIAGLVLALVIIFKKKVSPPLILAYGVAEGLFLGGVSAVIGNAFGGAIVMQAVIGTLAVFGGMLVVYKTGAVRVTPRFTKWLLGAMVGVVGLMVVNLIAGFFVDGGLGLRDGGPLAIIFSLVCIGVAAFSFLLDFDAADKAIRAGAPEKLSWYIAFGLTVTLVWLYLEILRLLSYFQGE